RLGSSKATQWDRSLLQKMYEIADAVAEHRSPPHLHDKPIWFEPKPFPIPFPKHFEELIALKA
ncbi:MAG TPA: hypothetical protein V6D23_28305, partial [Candidatus Obscuribacterales bacterium]